MSNKKLIGFNEEEFREKVNPINQELVEDFLSQNHLSGQTLKQYKSALYIFCTWVHDNCKNKSIPELRPRDARKYQDWLIAKGLSPSAIKFKRSAVSSLCGFIEVYYDKEYDNFRNIYTKAIPNVAKSAVKEKIPLTIKELKKLTKELEKREDWQKLAYVYFTYSTGCRREESRQLLKEVASYSKAEDKDGNQKSYYITHSIRAKGKGREGKVRKFTFDEKAKVAMENWVKFRDTQVEKDDCPYMFVSKGKDGYRQISANTFNLWCQEFSKILGGRPVHPHLFRSSRATNAVVDEGKSLSAVQKLLGHESSQTTEIYVVRNDEDDLDELY